MPATRPAPVATAERVLLTRHQAAEYFGISLRTLHKWRELGKLHPVMLGNSVRYHREDLERIARAGFEN